MRAVVVMELTREEIESTLPYNLICMTRYGSAWDTLKRKRRWTAEFTDEERDCAEGIFRNCYKWAIKKGVPESVTMSLDMFRLWQKLGVFCSLI